MPILENTFYRSREEILAEKLAAFQGAIPNIYVGDDGIVFILSSIEAGQLENAFLANQLLLEDIFIQTAGLQALMAHGEQFEFEMKLGTRSSGALQFSGDGGTYIPIGTEVGYDPGGGLEIVYFETVIDGTLPNPGVPGALTAAVGAAGAITGTLEYQVTFVTAEGESLPSAVSNAVVLAAQRAELTNIPIGGPGTTQRKIYRRENGTGNFKLIATLPDNTDVDYQDNAAVPSGTTVAPTVDTARRLTLAAESQDIGIEGNVAAGTITELTNAPATLTGVINPASFSGATDPEDMEEFRQRLLTHVRNPQSGSPGDLKSWAEEIDGVETATVFVNDNLGVAADGHNTIRISGPNGTIPGGAVIAAVQATLDERDVSGIINHVTTFTAQVTAVTVDVTTDGTYTLADVTPSVEQAIKDYINGLAVGATLRISGITDAVFGLAGVLDVVVTTPATNQTTAATTKRTPGTITVT